MVERENVDRSNQEEPESRTSRDTATPTSRPVYMLFRSSTINLVIDARRRW